MRRMGKLAAGAAVLLACVAARAQDWPGWRGPLGSGVTTDSTTLVNSFAEDGPKKLWESAELHDSGRGGWGTVIVAGDRAFVFADWCYDVPIEERVLDKNHLNAFGYAKDMPEDLSKKVEEARTSETRQALDRKAVNAWVDEWLKANVPNEQRRFRGAAQTRLRAGAEALPLADLAKIATIADKEFPKQAALERWIEDNALDERTKKELLKRVKKTRRDSKDYLVCLDATTGEMTWKTEVPSRGGQRYNVSGTPAFADGRVYALTASCTVVCLDAGDGRILWKKEPFGKVVVAHSSVCVVDGVVVATAHGTVGLDAKTGELLWEAKGLRNYNASPVPWKTEGGTRVVVNSRKLTCLDPRTGKVIWEAPGGGAATPTIDGNHLALILRKKLTAYRLSADKAEKLWEHPFADEFTSPVIHDGHVYAVGTALRSNKTGRGICVEADSGRIMWDSVVEGQPNCSSPIVADGKLIAFAGKDVVLIEANPEGYKELARHKVNSEAWSSPSLAGGKLLVRTGDRVLCFGLAK